MRQTLVPRRSKRALLAVLLVAAALVVGASPATAATLRVCPSGCPFTTIGAALAAAANGDKIQLAAGTYGGGFTIDKSVTLLGVGSGKTTISGGGTVATVATGTV